MYLIFSILLMLGAICALYNTIRGNDSNLLIVFYVQINFRQKLAQGFPVSTGTPGFIYSAK